MPTLAQLQKAVEISQKIESLKLELNSLLGPVIGSGPPAVRRGRPSGRVSSGLVPKKTPSKRRGRPSKGTRKPLISSDEAVTPIG